MSPGGRARAIGTSCLRVTTRRNLALLLVYSLVLDVLPEKSISTLFVTNNFLREIREALPLSTRRLPRKSSTSAKLGELCVYLESLQINKARRALSRKRREDSSLHTVVGVWHVFGNPLAPHDCGIIGTSVCGSSLPGSPLSGAPGFLATGLSARGPGTLETTVSGVYL